MNDTIKPNDLEPGDFNKREDEKVEQLLLEANRAIEAANNAIHKRSFVIPGNDTRH